MDALDREAFRSPTSKIERIAPSEKMSQAVVTGSFRICTTYATKPDIDTCFARVDVLRAPKGKLAELITLVDDNNLMDAPPHPKWVKMQLDRLSSANPWGSEAVQPYVRMQAAVVNCQATALGIRVLDDPSVFEHPFDRDPTEPIRFSQRIANPSPSNVFDWADLVLNFMPEYRYENRCSGSSLIRKWSNETGQWYRTANVYANPNGALPGVWTDTTVAANPSPQ